MGMTIGPGTMKRLPLLLPGRWAKKTMKETPGEHPATGKANSRQRFLTGYLLTWSDWIWAGGHKAPPARLRRA